MYSLLILLAPLSSLLQTQPPRAGGFGVWLVGLSGREIMGSRVRECGLAGVQERGLGFRRGYGSLRVRILVELTSGGDGPGPAL